MQQLLFPLIVTATDDVHSDALADEIHRRGLDCHRLNTDLLATSSSMAWTLGDLRLQEAPHSLRASSVHSVVWRRPSPPDLRRQPPVEPQVAAYIEDETVLTIGGIIRASFRHLGLWISHPDHIRRATFKPVQLSLAQALGFHVPDTIITNDPDKARLFIHKHARRVVTKIIGRTPTSLPPGRLAYTANLAHSSEAAIDAALSGVRLCPTLLQEYVPKRYELRVTCFGALCFAVALHSQESPRCRDDWRLFTFDSSGNCSLRHEPADLPSTIADRCRILLRTFGLNYGCFDFIVTPDGEYVFLEVNPNGQFLWLQDLLPELKLVSAWTDLVTGAGQPLVGGNNEIL